jgi:predicted HicB family RNase H-like nuclease
MLLAELKIRLDPKLKEKIKLDANKKGMSMNKYLIKLINKEE